MSHFYFDSQNKAECVGHAIENTVANTIHVHAVHDGKVG